jgi:hypothetical protein
VASKEYQVSLEYGATPSHTEVVSPPEPGAEFKRLEDLTRALLTVSKMELDKKREHKS